MKTKIIPANNFKGIHNVKPVEFTNREELSDSVIAFFEEFEKPYGITSNTIGYVIDEDTNESVGYIEEHYVDSGSVDYYYTQLNHG